MKDVPIAVIGMACRFPGANDADTYWKNVLEDVYSIAPLPPDRFHGSRYFDPEIGAYGKSYCSIGGLVNPPKFDPAAYRLPPKVIASTDEAHLWALDVARSAFENAGWDPFALEGANVGVVIGHARGSMLTSDMGFATAVEGMLPALRDVAALRDSASLSLGELERRVVRVLHDRYPKRTEDGGTGTMTSALAGLITNTFGLTGRHMVVDAACASSLAALDIGISGLVQGRLDAALIGGASYSQEMSVVMFAQSRALSPDGTFPFDQRANGFISSDGFGLLLLKRMDDALRDGDKIRAVIRAVAGSCDGKGKALWAPRREGQVLAMSRAYQMSGIDPATVSLIEAHATSTPLGDRTELEALHEFYRGDEAGKGRAPMPIGSVKGNIGHCREAAGAAGLIKAILALEHATLPPTGNFRSASKEIPWEQLAVEVLTAPRPWKSDGVRRAGVNAFGIGGLNYHVIVEEAPPEKRTFAVTSAPIKPARCDVAIVGIGGKFPRAGTVAKFWENLTDARDVSSTVPADRWDRSIYHAPGDRQHYRTYLDKGAFITDFEPDWRRYQVPPKLIERNDPLQFMILESALDAFADAGIDLEQIDRQRAAVLIGSVFGSDYALELSLAIRSIELAETVAAESGRPEAFDEVLTALRKRFPSINEDSSGSFSSSTLASRTAKTLDLMGPAYAIDAACASSLASLEAACELLRGGLVDIVAYGGADRGMRVQRYEAYCQFYALTKDQPRPFDKGADGFMPGEGAAVCILKRLEDAERDGDHVYAVIKGVGSSGNGTRGGLHKPSALGLSTAMKRALDQSRLDPNEVRFVECHGGATPLGDRTEVESIREAYGAAGRPPLVIGSVKSNVGHTQGAAGAIALVKAALAIDRGEIPPTRGFIEPHPDHRFGDELRVNQVRETLPPGESGLRAAGVSSMGLAGVNYHAVLQAHPRLTGRAEKRNTAFRIADISAEALARQVASADAHALMAEVRIGAGDHVVSLAALDERDLSAALGTLRKAGFAEGADEFRRKQGIFYFAGAPHGATKLCFAFSGQGSQYPGMMRAFAETLPPVKRIVDRFDVWLTEHRREPISKVLFSGEPIPNDVFLIQAAVLAGDLMAFEALRSIGLEPSFVTGHSFGDYAALVAAGCWSLEDALAATDLRARAIEAGAADGGMTSVTASKAALSPILREANAAGYVAAANVNAPDQVVIAGTIAALERAEALLAKQKIETQRLPIPRAFHSTLMAAAKPTLAAGLAKIAITAPKVPYLSSITGRFEEEPEAIRRALIEQLTLPVDFVSQVKLLIAEGATVFVECGPKGVLTGLVKRIAAHVDAISTDDANRPGAYSLARIEALLDARNAAREAAPSPLQVAPPSHALALFEGDRAEALLAREGFTAFWTKTRPSIASLVESLWAAERPQPAEEELLEAPTAVPTLIATNVASRADVEQYILKALCEQSGYPPEIITLDADLEADLGIDTVKQAQVLGKVRDKFDLRTDEKLSLRDFPTLRHVVNYVDGQLDVVRSAAPRRTLVTMVDVTERRTRRPAAAAAPVAAQVPVSIPVPVPAPVPMTPQAKLQYEIPPPRIALPKDMARPATVLHLHGTAREIGRQHGDALRDPILEVMHEYLFFVGEQGLSLLTNPATLPTLHALFDAPSIAEIEGVAEAIGVPYIYLLAYNLDAALFPAFRSGCTQSVRLGRDNGGSMIHLVNEDSPLLLHLGGLHPRVVQIRRRTDGPHPERRTVFFSMAGQIVGPNALSDSGLSITSTTLLDGRDPELLPNGLPHPQLVKRIAEEASSLEEAIQIATSARRAGRWSLLVSDADADRARYLEYDGDQILTDDEIESSAVTANHSICDPAPGCSVPEHSAHREARARTLLSAEPILTKERAQAILRDRHDGGRNREVPHPTMNTVRRADNVMSLVIEPQQRTLHVTDRVVPPGSSETDGARFLTIRYGDAPRATKATARTSTVLRTSAATGSSSSSTSTAGYLAEQVWKKEELSRFTSSGAGVVPMDEVMRRHVIRAITEDPPPSRDRWQPRRCLIAGDGPFTDAIAAAISARGGEVRVVATSQLALRTLESFRPDALGIVLPPPETPAWQLHTAAWHERRERAVVSPFRLLRAFGGAGTVFGVTFLGGALGFENAAQGAGEQGALLGLLKAVRREHEQLRVQALDLSPSETPAVAADALLAELDAGSPRLEVGLLRRKRIRLAMAERPADSADGPPLPRRWLVTGGARGITAKMCVRLAELCQPVLHLVGRHPLPPAAELARLRVLDEAGLGREKQALLERMKAGDQSFTPLAWKNACDAIDKSLEIDRNLAEMRAAGSEVHYTALDVADREAVRGLLASIEPVDGLMHGAGVEVAKPFDKKSDELFEQTVAPKIDGLVNLLALTQERPFSHVVVFGSVSGRFGGHGQTDYSLANEGLSRLLHQYRALSPAVRAAVVDWAAFSEVGLAARSSAKAFLERSGQAFMTPAEGANHVVRELWAGLSEPEVVICERMEALDLDRLLVPESSRNDWRAYAAECESAPLLGTLVLDGARTLTERIIAASEPFLDQHRMGAVPILPAVIGLEMMAELAGPGRSLIDVRIEQPLKVPEGQRTRVRIERSGEALRVMSSPVRPDGVILEPDRVFVRAKHAPAAPPTALQKSKHGDFLPYPYPSGIDRTPGSRAIFHGPAFRCLEGVAAGEHGGVAHLLVPAPVTLVPGSRADRWRVPAALLDGCLQAVGLLGRMLFSAIALPAGFGRVDVAPRALSAAGERAELVIAFREVTRDALVADFSVMGADGPLLSVVSYRAQVVPET